jgi:hypothetical protein
MAVQWRQLQFHCGKPPPAAAPRTWIFKIKPVDERDTNFLEAGKLIHAAYPGNFYI